MIIQCATLSGKSVTGEAAENMFVATSEAGHLFERAITSTSAVSRWNCTNEPKHRMTLWVLGVSLTYTITFDDLGDMLTFQELLPFDSTYDGYPHRNPKSVLSSAMATINAK